MYHQELQVALEVLRQAAGISCQIRSQLINPDAILKPDASPVTVADFAVQALVCRALNRSFPQDAIVAEEDADQLRLPEMTSVLAQVTDDLLPAVPDATADRVCDWIDLGKGQPQGRFWVLDPIDGTKGFIRGDQYALALALIDNGQIVVGVLACPALPRQQGRHSGQLFYAVRGAGAFAATEDNQPDIRLALPERLPAESFRLLESVEIHLNDRRYQERIARQLGMTLSPLRVDSQVKYGLLAMGQGAIYLRLPPAHAAEQHEKIWDHAAGVLIVEEAGGRVSDMDGLPLDFTVGNELAANRGIVAAWPGIHAKAISLLSGK